MVIMVIILLFLAGCKPQTKNISAVDQIPKVSVDCTPGYFNSIEVKENQIIMKFIEKTYNDTYVFDEEIGMNRQIRGEEYSRIKSYEINKDDVSHIRYENTLTNEITQEFEIDDSYSEIIMHAGIGEEYGEVLSIIDWEGNSASFKVGNYAYDIRPSGTKDRGYTCIFNVDGFWRSENLK